MARLLIRDLTPGTTYYLQFRADDGTQISEWSRRFQITTNADTVPPDVPVWDTPDWAVDGDTFVARWLPINTSLEQNKDFSHYELVLTANSISVTIKTNNLAFVLSFEQNRAFFGDPQPTVDAKLRALDTNGNASAYTTIESATNPAPPNVSSVIVNPLYDSIEANWPVVVAEDLVGYRVMVSTTSSTSGYSTVYEGPNPTYTHTTYSYSLDHWFRVYAIDKFGSVSASPVTSGAVRPKSGFALDTTPPANPTGVTATASFNTTTQESYIDVAWTANTEPDLIGYVIRYGQVSGSWTYMNLDKTATGGRLVVEPGKSYYIGVVAKDLSNNISGWSTPTPDPTSSIADTTAPSTPTAPTVSVNTLQAQVTVPGTKAAGGAMESDVAYYEIYGSTTTGFTTADANMLGTIQSGPAMVGTFDIPASGSSGSTETWYFKIIAVDRSNNKSAASAQTTGAVGLISTANIADLAVTNAKIGSLAVDKLTAGTGLATDFTILSTLTLGASGNDGVIQSYDYVTSSGATGFNLDSDGLIIKTGQIEAAALILQDSANIIPNAMADFELNEFYYFDNAVPATPVARGLNWSTGTDMTISLDSAFVRFGIKSLKIIQTAATGRTIYFASTSTANNIFFPNDGAQYFVSFWVRPSVTNSLSIAIQNGGSSVSGGTVKRVVDDATTLVTGSWQQVYFLTTGLSIDSGALRMTLPAVAGTWYIDGIMVERKIAGAIRPGAYRPPSVTEIAGGMIKTGSIQSSNLGLEWDTATQSFITGTQPSWAIDLDGSATFGNLQVLGNVIVGDSNDIANSDKYVMASAFYSQGSDGWIMHGDGWVEFNQIVANTIEGSSVRTGTLAADKLTAGILGADIKVMGGGGLSIYALGALETDPPIIQLNPTVGIVVDPVGPGKISIPSNGTDPLKIENISLSALDAKFSGNVQIWGSNNYISGEVMLEKSVADPTVAPTVVSGWVDPSTYFSTTPPAGYATFGLAEDHTGNYWVTGIFNAPIKNGQIWKIDKTTGSYNAFVGNMYISRQVSQTISGIPYYATITTGPDLLRGVGKIVVGATTYIATLVHYPAQSGSTTGYGAGGITHSISYSLPAYWSVRLYNSTLTYAAGAAPAVTWTWTPPGSSNTPFIGSDGTYLYIAYASTITPYAFYVLRYAHDGTGGTTIASEAGWAGVNTATTAIWYGNADLGVGVNRWFVGGSQTYFHSLSGVGVANETSTQFARANGETQYGLHWDGTQFRSINNSGKIYKYSTFLGTETSRNIDYCWFDSDSTGGQHKSLQSPSTAYTTLKRGWFKVTTPPPVDNGGTDDPDQVIIYIDDIDNGAYSPSGGSVNHLFSTFATSGSGPVTGTSEFATLAAAGIIKTRQIATNGAPIISIKGDGNWTWDPGASVQVAASATANAVSTTNVTIAGWSVTVTSPGLDAVYLVSLEPQWQTSTSGGIGLIELLVDGVVTGPAMLCNSPTNAAIMRIEASKCYRVTGLSAGSHTFTSRTRLTGGTGSVQVNSGASTMLVQRVA